MSKSLIIGADFVPTESNHHLFESGKVDELIDKDLLDLLNESSYKVFNLEVPLTDIESPIPKCGPNLVAKTSSINSYKAIGVDLLTVANNHILDQGDQGFFSTLRTLSSANIRYVGGGKNLTEAIKPVLVEFGTKIIGIYACCEHEFCIATEDSCGANPFDPLESLDHVAELNEKSDFVIVLYHGGKEHYRYPSPQLQKNCRKLIEKGANLVVCQHSHCIGCQEEYQSGLIIYGQGNFLFDRCNNEFWKTSLLIKMDENYNISFIPLVKDGFRVRLANSVESDQILKMYYNRSKEIDNQAFIEEQYSRFAESVIDNYLIEIGARLHLLGRIINKISKGRYYRFKTKLLYNNRRYLAALNYIECEAHCELLLKGLRVRAKNDRK